MSPPRAREREFVNFLQLLVDREDRAPLAALRRGLGKTPGEAVETHRYVMPFLSRESRRGEEEAYYLIAALFAVHQVSWPQVEGGVKAISTNLGASLAQLVHEIERENVGGSNESIERRFVALLNCRRDDLPNHLRHSVSLLKGRSVPVDWAQLLRDLQEWEWESRSVQRAWARAFWQRPEREAEDHGGAMGEPGDEDRSAG